MISQAVVTFWNLSAHVLSLATQKRFHHGKQKRILLVIARIQTKLTRIARKAQRKGNYVI